MWESALEDPGEVKLQQPCRKWVLHYVDTCLGIVSITCLEWGGRSSGKARIVFRVRVRVAIIIVTTTTTTAGVVEQGMCGMSPLLLLLRGLHSSTMYLEQPNRDGQNRFFFCSLFQPVFCTLQLKSYTFTCTAYSLLSRACQDGTQLTKC